MDRILKASYGDEQQRAANNANIDKAKSLSIHEQHKKKANSFSTELPPTPSIGPACPGKSPFWNTKHQGKAYGAFCPLPNKPTPTKAHVEVKPGVLLNVQQVKEKKNGAGAAAAQRNKDAVSKDDAGELSRIASSDRQLGSHAPGVLEMEDAMRAAARARAKLHVTVRVVLLKAFAQMLDKKHNEMGPKDKVSIAQFIAAWQALGIKVPQHLALAIFSKHGHDAAGRMPVQVFLEDLLQGAPKLVVMSEGLQKGQYQAGKPASHTGLIIYPQCKSGVLPPSDWDPALAKRSVQLPEAALELEFVHGYDGFQATSPNLFYNDAGELVYYAAGVGIVYQQASHSQRFFIGHDDDILCLALAPDRRTVATGQAGKDPCVIVWDSNSMKQLQRLQHGYGARGIQAVCFARDGNHLASISLDNSHSLTIWDWRAGLKLVEQRTQPGAPPAVYGVVWSHFEPRRLVTYGQNHIRFYELQAGRTGPAAVPAARAAAAAGNSLSLQIHTAAGMYCKVATHTITSACFLPSGRLITGASEGYLCSWQDGKCGRQVAGHARGPVMPRPDGSPSYGGARCLALQQGNRSLLSAGADGHIIRWDVSSGDLGAQLQLIPLRLGGNPAASPSLQPAIVALDCKPGSNTFMAGTSSCDIWEVDGSPEVLLQGQQGSLAGLAMNPVYKHVYATVSLSEKVCIWNAVTHKVLRVVSLGKVAVCACFSPDGQHLAVGLRCGGIKVLSFWPSTQQVWWGKPSRESVDVIKYSPDGKWLAAGSRDQLIHMFDVRNGYQPQARCRGPSSTITHLDWAADSSVIMTNDQAYEILYFEPRTGKQVPASQVRDQQWSSWTCVLGFPVMGIWPPDSDGTDINSLDRSPSGQYVLTADDKGRVKLFHHPCVVQDAACKEYMGHCAHVVGVRWGADERYAVSIGGRDRAVMQWRLLQKAAARVPHHVAAPWEAVDGAGVMWAQRRS